MKKSIVFAWFLCTVFAHMHGIELQNLPTPYCNITEVLPLKDHGWYLNAQGIDQLVQHNEVINVLEVGSWLGKSTRHMASLIPGNGKVYAVDTWEGSEEHLTDPKFSGWLSTLYQQFLSNMIHYKLTHKVVPLRMTSLEAADQFKNQGIDNIDLIYLDAAHDFESVTADLEAYFPLVKGNKAILCGDDWTWESVKSAVVQFALKYDLSIYATGNFWFLKEIGYGYHYFRNYAQISHADWSFNLKK